MGIKGTVRRNQDGDFIHANVDTDVFIAPEPELGSTDKPEEIFRIIEQYVSREREGGGGVETPVVTLRVNTMRTRTLRTWDTLNFETTFTRMNVR
jgi:hypothetical protein